MIIIGAILNIINYLFNLYIILLVLISILRLGGANESLPFVRGIAILTDPPAAWLRRRFPRLLVQSQGTYIDLSPFVLIILVVILQNMIPAIVTYLFNVRDAIPAGSDAGKMFNGR